MSDRNVGREAPPGHSWFRFSLRMLLVLVAVCASAAFFKYQLDRREKLDVARRWVRPLVDGSRPEDPEQLRVWSPTHFPGCPVEMSPRDEIEVLSIGIRHLETPRERAAAVTVLLEWHPESARQVLHGILRRTRDEETRRLVTEILRNRGDT